MSERPAGRESERGPITLSELASMPVTRLKGVGGRKADALAAVGVDVRLEHLDVGDYALGNGVLVERKTVRGLHLDVVEGRLWSQIGRLRAGAAFPFLVVEGRDIDNGPLGPHAVRAICVGIISQGVSVIFASGVVDTATWLRLVAIRFATGPRGRDRPRYAQRRKVPQARVAEAMLAAVPTISVTRGRALLDHFGSLSEVLAAGPDAWQEVPGIGPAIARELDRAIA
jgi:Fanconi anemia group M protein